MYDEANLQILNFHSLARIDYQNLASLTA